LVPAYVRLLRDNEAEVRIAAAGKVTKFCRILNPELSIQHILPCVKVCVSGKEILTRCLEAFLGFSCTIQYAKFICTGVNSWDLLLQELSSDSSQHVRSALASVIMGMAPVLGKVCTYQIAVSVVIML